MQRLCAAFHVPQKKKLISAIRNRRYNADSGLAVWPAQCHTSRSVVGSAILIPHRLSHAAPRGGAAPSKKKRALSACAHCLLLSASGMACAAPLPLSTAPCRSPPPSRSPSCAGWRRSVARRKSWTRSPSGKLCPAHRVAPPCAPPAPAPAPHAACHGAAVLALAPAPAPRRPHATAAAGPSPWQAGGGARAA